LRALLLTAITPLFVTLGGSLMLELVVPVVAALGTGEGPLDARAAMALFLLASVHCALMVMMLKVAGTMAAAWNVFGLASSEAASQPSSAAQSAAIAAPAISELGTSAALSRATVVSRASAEPAVAMVHSSGGGTTGRDVRTHVTHTQTAASAPAASALPRLRARGIGSRFASGRTPAPREMIR
jgi:type IV secretion system protein VirB6